MMNTGSGLDRDNFAWSLGVWGFGGYLQDTAALDDFLGSKHDRVKVAEYAEGLLQHFRCNEPLSFGLHLAVLKVAGTFSATAAAVCGGSGNAFASPASYA